jgi:hypothetical protein
VLIEIVDRGVGMGGPELDDANARLARPTAMDVSASRRMGLFVVARLASRHGMGVRLTGGGGAGGGTTASVIVPARLVSPAGGAAPPQPPQSPKPPVSAPNGLPGTEFQPLQRPVANGSSRAPSLSALVAGADAPVGDPAGPAPAGGLAWPKPAVNGAPSEQPPSNGLPTRRPGQFLRQNQNPPRPAPPEEPPATPEQAPAAGPDEQDPAPQEPAQEPAGESAQDGAQEPAKEPAKEPVSAAAPATEEAAPPADPPTPPGPADALPRRVPAAPPTRAETPAPAGSALFAPIVSPQTGARPERDPMSETTPIFEEIASAWFRADRPIPVSYDDRTGLYREPTAAPARPTSLPPTSGQRAAGPAPSAPTPPAPPAAATAAAPPATAFASAADDGWRASAAAASSRPDELTPAGLPKRRPRARLVPGAAAPAGPPAVAPARTADAIRGRLASYQDGVRQGREDRLRRGAAAAAGRPGDGSDEEGR